MRYEVLGNTQVHRKLQRIANAIRDNSISNAGRIRRSVKDLDNVIEFSYTVSKCNRLGLVFCGTFGKVHTYIELKYGMLTVEQAKLDCPNGKLIDLEYRKAVTVLNKFLDKHFKV